VLLKRYFDTVFPRSFFLKKPLDYCSSADLEQAVTRWWKPVQPFSGDQSWHQIEPPDGHILRLAGLTPDGRCIIYTTRDGAVYYLLVDRPHEPHLVAPALDQTRITATRITFDYLDMQGIDSTGSCLLEERLFPTTFKMAVARHGQRIDGTRFTVVEVWQVTALLQEGQVHGYVGQRLASFHEQGLRIESCSLYGKHFAYASSNSALVAVVDWTQVPPDSTVYPRVYIRFADAEVCTACISQSQAHSSTPKRIALLPRQQILIHSDRTLQIWKWGRDCTVSSLVASELEAIIPPANSTPQRGQPSWRHQCSKPVYMERGLVPIVTNSSIRFVLAVVDGLLGLSIPTTGTEDGVTPAEVTLVEGESSDAPQMLQDYAYQRGVAISSRSNGTSCTLGYPWPDFKPCQNSSIVTFVGPSNAAAVYLNETSDCIHIFYFESPKYHTVYARNY
jgi:hypothetical protein